MIWKTGLTTFSVLLLLLHSATRAGDPVITAAWARLEIARHESLVLLERAVLQTPERVDYWIGLLRVLKMDNASPFVCRCYMQAALQAHPQSLALRWECLRLMPAAEALDELEKLAPLEKNAQRLADARGLLTRDERLPADWNAVHFLEEWAVYLVRQQEWQRAEEVLANGLERYPKSQTLRICRALLLVEQDKFEDAVAEVEANHGLQTLLLHEQWNIYPNVSDRLLAKKQPRLAARLYGKQPDEKVLAGHEGLLLGQALLQAGDVARAELVFEKTEKVGAQLLVIANLLELKKTDDAEKVADELLDELEKPGRDQREERLALENPQLWPHSLQPALTRAIAWLYASYPKSHALLRAHISEKPFQYRETIRTVEPWSKKRRELEHAGSSYKIGSSASEHGEYALAAQSLREFLLSEQVYKPSQNPAQPPVEVNLAYIEQTLADGSCRWRLNQLRAASLAYYRTRPAELFAARQLLSNLQATRAKWAPLPGTDWLSDEEVIAAAVKTGEPLLPFISEALEAQQPGQDLAPWIQLVAKLGTKADAPALVQLAKQKAQILQSGLIAGFDDVKRRAQAQQTLDELNAVLEQLTGEKCQHEVAAARVAYWQLWWLKNSAEIVRGK